MKNLSQSGLVILFLLLALIAATIFLAYQHFDNNPVAGGSSGVTGGMATGVDMQKFSGDGYALAVPASWYVEQNSKDVVTVYPDHALAASSSTPSCKIAMSVFPYAPNTSEADWIAAHIGADPSLAVTEKSSEDVTVSGGSGVKWIGIIDGAPTTLVYVFSQDHAYEIAPSVINETSADDTQCTDELQTFTSQLTIS